MVFLIPHPVCWVVFSFSCLLFLSVDIFFYFWFRFFSFVLTYPVGLFYILLIFCVLFFVFVKENSRLFLFPFQQN